MNEPAVVAGSAPRRAADWATATPAFAALFVLSGIAGLTYEVVWSRYLVHVFGVTAFAVSTVLVSFMGGMALGAVLVGRWAERIRRPLRAFALLEAGIAVYALALPVLLRGVESLHAALFPGLRGSFYAQSVARFALCVLVLLVPTVLMGGTLPALGQGLLRTRGRFGFGVGLLYFTNTLGAAIGCWTAGFVAIPALGLRGTTLAAAAVNALVAVTAWAIDARAGADATAATDDGPDPPVTGGAEDRDVAPSWPYAVAFASGFLALAFEVVWFRVLVLVFGSTVYSFSAMLSSFLLGLALGSFAVGLVVDRIRRPARLLLLTQGSVAVLALAGLLAVNRMPAWFLGAIARLGLDFEGMNRAKMLLSLATLLPPALAFGATFPIVVRLAGSATGRAGRSIGGVYALNTLGAIFGSFLTGFVFLPTLGSERTLQMVVLGALAVTFGCILAERGPVNLRVAGPAAAVVIVATAVLVFSPPWDRRLLGAGVYFEPSQYLRDGGTRVEIEGIVGQWRVTTFTEGYNDTIISYESPQGKFITVNGSTTASDHFEDMFSQRMLGHLPMALHPGPVRSACIVGLGAGVTAGSIGVYDLERLVAVELEEGVFAASRFFSRENHDVLENPAVEVVIDDGQAYLRLTDERFDVISSAPNFPSLTGSGALYGVEFFRLCRARLAPGGIMAQFIPIWRLAPEQVRTILGSFLEVFPHARVFNTGLSLVALGRDRPFPKLDLEELRARLGRDGVRDSLAEIGVRGPMELLSYYQFDETEGRALVGDAPSSTLDHPRVEFEAPRSLFAFTVAPNLRAIREIRPGVEGRADRLGLDGEWRDSFVVLSRAYEAAQDAEIHFDEGRFQEGMETAIPAAESGQRYAAYVIADRAEKVGMDLQHAGQLEAARAQFLLALRYEADRLNALTNLGHVDLFLGRIEEAERTLAYAVERFPRSAVAQVRYGTVLETKGDVDGAEARYRAAVDLQPSLGIARTLLGRLLVGRGRHEEALVQLDLARDLGESSDGTMVLRGQVLMALGRTGPAYDQAREAVDAHPGSASAHHLLAIAAAATGRDAESAAAEATARQLGGREPDGGD